MGLNGMRTNILLRYEAHSVMTGMGVSLAQFRELVPPSAELCVRALHASCRAWQLPPPAKPSVAVDQAEECGTTLPR